MRHSRELEYRKYVKGYGFLSFARNFGDKYGKKLMNTAIKTGTSFNSKYSKKLTDTEIKTGKDFATIAGLLYSLYSSKQISKTVYKNLIATI